MSDNGADPGQQYSPEDDLRRHLARAGGVLGAVGPVLRHLLDKRDDALFGDEVLARLRAMLGDLARQLAGCYPGEAPCESLVQALADVPGLVSHCHALALEWAMTQRLAERQRIDPVLSPLMQALVASSEAETSAQAMQALAAQARFAQSMRRMQLPLHELPAELLHGAVAQAGDGALAARLAQGYHEAGTRLGLIAALVSGMGAGAVAGLALEHAGIALFATTLAMCGAPHSGTDRDQALLAMQDGQQALLAVKLRAAGLKLAVVQTNLLVLHPLAPLPEGLSRLSVERAGELLGDVR